MIYHKFERKVGGSESVNIRVRELRISALIFFHQIFLNFVLLFYWKHFKMNWSQN